MIKTQIIMRKRIKILCLCLLTGSIASQVYAQKSGTCGESLTWELNDDCTILTISGTGEMDDYSSYTYAPWHAYYDEIKTVVLNEGITKIGDWAFFMCRNMDAPTIPNTVQSIGDGAFCGCHGVQSLDIPGSVQSIGNEAFESCDNLTSIHFDEGVKELGLQAFWYCSGLTSVVIPNSVTILGASLFSRCTSLTSVTIGEGVQEIGSFIFDGCDLLETLVYNAIECEEAGMNTDFGLECHSLTHLTVGDKVRIIPERAFIQCKKLTSVNIPNSVEYIGMKAFYGCNGLLSLTIGESVRSIGYAAFDQCSNLQEMTVLPTEPPTFERLYYYPTYNPFQGVPSRIPVYVPSESIGAYKAVDDWKSMNLQPIGGTGVQTTTVDQITGITIAGNEVLLTPGLTAKAQVYDMAGRLVLSTSELRFSLPKGIYLIKVGNETMKVVLQ